MAKKRRIQKKKGATNSKRINFTFWFLTKLKLKYLFFLGITLFVFFTHSIIFEYANNVYQNTLVSLGFSIKDISISGGTQKIQMQILKNLGISRGDNIFSKSTNDLYNNISKLGWIKNAIVKKTLPDLILIKIDEKVPVAIFQENSKFFLIDDEGEKIEEIQEKPKGMIVVVGEGAEKNYTKILNIIEKFEKLKVKLETIVFVRQRRWDVVLNGVLIKLPEERIERSFEILTAIIDNSQIMNREVNFIDLRSGGNVVINGIFLKKDKNKLKI